MPIINMIGFEECADYTDVVTSLGQSSYLNGGSILVGSGRRSGNALQLTHYTHRLGYALGSAVSSVSFMVKVTNLSGSSAVSMIGSNHGKSGNWDHGYLGLRSDGSMFLKGNSTNGDSVEFLPAGSIVEGQWYFVGFSIFVDNAGYIKARVNNQTIELYTDTRYNNYAATSSALIFTGYHGLILDDIVYSTDADFHLENPKRVDYIVPDSDLSAQDFTKVGTGSGFEEINQIIPDDASYLRSETQGDVSEFSLSDSLTLATTIDAIRLVSRTNAEEELGANNMNVSHRLSSGTEINVIDPVSTAGEFITISSPVSVINPDTGLPYTKAEIDSSIVRLEMI